MHGTNKLIYNCIRTHGASSQAVIENKVIVLKALTIHLENPNHVSCSEFKIENRKYNTSSCKKKSSPPYN